MDDAWVRAIVALPFGLVIGSFMTVVVSRVPAGESVIKPRSLCPSCGVPIRSRDNVPVVGWFVLRGRCRNCGERISALYPALEIVTAALFVAAFVVFDDLWVAALIAALLSLMPAITVIDIQHRIIPNRLMYPALIAFPICVLIAFAAGGDVDPLRAALGLAIFGGGLFIVAAVSGEIG